jgi:DNA-binding transcriptional ArsR family regulator
LAITIRGVFEGLAPQSRRLQQFISTIIEISLASLPHFYNSRNMKIEPTYPDRLAQAASAFAALGSEQRLAVLRALVRAGPQGLSIGALGTRTDVRGSTLTHHLKLLTAAGLVKQVRQGRSTICAAVAYDEVKALSTFLLTECCADADHPTAEHPHG